MSKIIEISSEHWKSIEPERIMSYPIEVVPGVTRSDNNPSYAVDENGTEWICGFFNGRVCRVAVSKPQQSSAVN